MKYIMPHYEKETVEATDIVLTSIDFGNGATLKEKDENTAQVSASAFDVLGLR